MDANKITAIIVDASIKIHNAVGPGCFERVYEELLYYELTNRGLNVDRQVLLPITYESLIVQNAYKIDLLVEDKVITEIKSVEYIVATHYKQIKTHLTFAGLKNGMLLNFQVAYMKEGIYRVFNNFGR